MPGLCEHSKSTCTIRFSNVTHQVSRTECKLQQAYKTTKRSNWIGIDTLKNDLMLNDCFSCLLFVFAFYQIEDFLCTPSVKLLRGSLDATFAIML